MTLRIAISVGDPAGIGPEVIIKALARAPRAAQYLVYGSAALVGRSARMDLAAVGGDVRWQTLGAEVEAASSGVIQLASLEAAVAAIRRGEADALCTAPITKHTIAGAGFLFPGHTEYLGHAFGVARPVMLLAGPVLRVAPLTIHQPLAAVAGALRAEQLIEVVAAVAVGLKDFGCERPRIAVLGLNPHAGENGLLGEEETALIAPAIREAQQRLGDWVTVLGPFAADGFFAPALDWLSAGACPHDAVIGCYHDQVLTPFKMLHRRDGVNVTLGLPFVRTSPAHGSAKDIAGQRLADETSMLCALEMALTLGWRRRKVVSR